MKTRYKERYELHKVSKPEDMGHPGKPYCVKHFIPQEGGSWVAYGAIKYFSTQEEAQAYYNAQQALLKAKEQRRNERTTKKN